MTRINTNAPSLIAQNRLRSSNRDLQTALTRLSTGLRINTGADDPAGLIASEALRSEITSLGKAISNTRRASQIISTADSALGQVSNLLNDIRGLVVEAANSGALSQEEIAANQLQIDSSLEAINRIAQTTTFQGRKLLDGSLDLVSSASSIASVRDVHIDQANLGATGQIEVEVVIGQAATQARLNAATSGFTAAANATVAFGDGAQAITLNAVTAGSNFNDVRIQFADDANIGDTAASAAYDADQKLITVTYNSAASAGNRSFSAVASALDSLADFNAAVTSGAGAAAFTSPAASVSTAKTGGQVLAGQIVFQLNGSSGAETFNFDAGTSADQVASAINLVSDSTGIQASFDATQGLQLTSTAYGSDGLIHVDVISEAAGGLFATSLSSQRATGTDIAAFVNGIAADGKANTLSINTSSLDLSLTVQDGSETRFAFSISGGGALFQLGPDVTSSQQARLGIASVNTARLGGPTGRLYELGSGQARSLTGDIQGAARIVDEAIGKVTSLRGRLGAFQATTLESNLVSLNETSVALQEAESSIRDADFAQESANLTRAQILVQAGTNVLALANQNPQSVLSLLR